ncbi:hypothetical protein LGMT14_02179 [Lactococcus garvieae]|nr:hypothetical protein LGMT14_02179 [Lactococcus garvieae]
MTQYSFPWNDVNGDRLYDADDFMRFFAAFLKTGVVMSFKDGLRVRSAQNGMNIQVGGGSAVIGGGSYLNDENIAIQVNVASSVQNRTDSVVFVWIRMLETHIFTINQVTQRLFAMISCLNFNLQPYL